MIASSTLLSPKYRKDESLSSGGKEARLPTDVVYHISEHLCLRDRSRLCMVSRKYLPVMWQASSLDIKHGTSFVETQLLKKFKYIRNLNLNFDYKYEDDITSVIEKGFRCPPTLMSLVCNATSVLDIIIEHPPQSLECLDIDESTGVTFGRLIRSPLNTILSIFGLTTIRHLKLGCPVLWAICGGTILRQPLTGVVNSSRLQTLKIFRLQSGTNISLLCNVMSHYTFDNLEMLELEGEYCTIYKNHLEVIRNACPRLQVLDLRGFTMHALNFERLEDLVDLFPSSLREIRLCRSCLPIPDDDKVLLEFIMWLCSRKFPYMEMISIKNCRPIRICGFPESDSYNSRPIKKSHEYQRLKSLLIADTIPASLVFDFMRDISASLVELSIDVGPAFKGQINIWNAIASITGNLERLYIKFDASNVRFVDEYTSYCGICKKQDGFKHNTKNQYHLHSAKPITSLKTLILENPTWFLLEVILPNHSIIEKLIVTCVQYPRMFCSNFKYTPIKLCLPLLKTFHFQTYDTGISSDIVGQLVTSVTTWAKNLESLSVYIDWGYLASRGRNVKYDNKPSKIDPELLDHIQRSCLKLKNLEIPAWILSKDLFSSLYANSEWSYTLKYICLLADFLEEKLFRDFCKYHKVLSHFETYHTDTVPSSRDRVCKSYTMKFDGRECQLSIFPLKDLKPINSSVASNYF